MLLAVVASLDLGADVHGRHHVKSETGIERTVLTDNLDNADKLDN